MQVGLHQFHSTTIEWLKTAVGQEGSTRHSLSRALCEREDWRGRCGQWCLSAGSKALPVLADRLGLRLPSARSVPFFAPALRDRPPAAAFPDLSLRCSLKRLGAITLERVGDVEDRRLWESMMASHHPEGWARAPGGQLRYWIRSEHHGRLGGIGFSSAGWHQQARDAFIGWSPDARAANLPLLICNHRFLLLSGVRVHALASRVWRLAAARVADDWEAAYAVRPVMAFTYVAAGFPGRSYRAARWRCCPQRTKGRRPDSSGGEHGVVHTVWMRNLCRRAGATPCAKGRAVRSVPHWRCTRRRNMAAAPIPTAGSGIG